MSALKEFEDFLVDHDIVFNTQEVAALDNLEEVAQNAFEEVEEVIPNVGELELCEFPKNVKSVGAKIIKKFHDYRMFVTMKSKPKDEESKPKYYAVCIRCRNTPLADVVESRAKDGEGSNDKSGPGIFAISHRISNHLDRHIRRHHPEPKLTKLEKKLQPSVKKEVEKAYKQYLADLEKHLRNDPDVSKLGNEEAGRLIKVYGPLFVERQLVAHLQKQLAEQDERTPVNNEEDDNNEAEDDNNGPLQEGGHEADVGPEPMDVDD